MSTETQKVDVQRAIDLCRDRDGFLNEDGRLMEYDIRKERQIRKLLGQSELADDYRASAERTARSVIEQHEQSRRRLTPLIRRSRKSDRRATAALTRIGSAS